MLGTSSIEYASVEVERPDVLQTAGHRICGALPSQRGCPKSASRGQTVTAGKIASDLLGPRNSEYASVESGERELVQAGSASAACCCVCFERHVCRGTCVGAPRVGIITFGNLCLIGGVATTCHLLNILII